MLDLLNVDAIALILAGENPAAGLTNLIRSWLGPVILLIISVMAIRFLVRSQLTQFAVFALVAVLVGVLFYTPELIEKIAKSFSSGASSAGWGN